MLFKIIYMVIVCYSYIMLHPKSPVASSGVNPLHRSRPGATRP